jgi:hypothetical protein
MNHLDEAVEAGRIQGGEFVAAEQPQAVVPLVEYLDKLNPMSA